MIDGDRLEFIHGSAVFLFVFILFIFGVGEGECKQNSFYEKCSMFVMPCSKCCVVKLYVNSTLKPRENGLYVPLCVGGGEVGWYRVMCKTRKVLLRYALVTAMKKSFVFLFSCLPLFPQIGFDFYICRFDY